jgi:two-component system, LytTR family, response regulator
MTISSIVIDDEQSAIDNLNCLLKEISGIDVSASARNIAMGLELILELRPMLVFLDIEMPGGDGFTLLDKLNELHIHPHIIFITGYNEAVKAYDYAAFDFLMKPIESDRLNKSINRLKKELTSHRSDADRIKLSSKNGFVWLNPDDILGCTAMGNHTEVFLKNGHSAMVIEQIGTLHKTLGEPMIRCHRSALINPNFLAELDRSSMQLIVVNDGQTIRLPVSRKGLGKVMGRGMGRRRKRDAQRDANVTVIALWLCGGLVVASGGCAWQSPGPR